jgi:CubicO group peptidase (beta-lactamase class C family)
MVFPDNDADSRITASAHQILKEGGTPQCSVWAQQGEGWQYRKTFHLHENDTARSDHERDDTTVYGIGSLTKIFVAYAVIILVDKLAKSNDLEEGKYEGLTEAWKRGIHKYLKISLPQEPTIENLLSHYHNLPSMNDFLFGPDGAVLMSKDDFLEVAGRIANDDYECTNKEDIGWRYSNGGYILAGLLIEKYSKMSLGEFLMENIFKPFKMEHTYVRAKDIEQLPQEARAPAHVVRVNGNARPVEYPRYFEDTVAFAALGVYSCTKDLANFFRALLDILSGKEIPGHHKIFVKRLLHPYFQFIEPASGSYSFCGYRTTFDTVAPGSHSINRIVSPPHSKSSRYTLSNGLKWQPMKTFYHGASVTGFEGCIYFMPDLESFVITLSNATGLVDTSDHISRLLVQEFFLTKHRLLPQKLFRVDIVEKARLGAEERRRFIEHHHPSQGVSHSQLNIEPTELTGTFVNEKYRQSITVSLKGQDLVAQFLGSAGSTKELQLIFIRDHTMLLRPLHSQDVTELSIDIFADWMHLELDIIRDELAKVVSLTRKRQHFSVVYERRSG